MRLWLCISSLALAASSACAADWTSLLNNLANTNANVSLCLGAVREVPSACGSINLPGVGSTAPSVFNRRAVSDTKFDLIGNLNATVLEKVCSAACQAALTNASSTCINFLSNVGSGLNLLGDLTVANISATFNLYDSFICQKDSSGNFCIPQLKSIVSNASEGAFQAIHALLEGNLTAEEATIKTLDATCTECTTKLTSAWLKTGSKGTTIDQILTGLDFACTKNSSGSYCPIEIGELAKRINDTKISDAVSIAKTAVCGTISPCIIKAVTALAPDSSLDLATLPLKAFLAPELCAIGNNATNATCLELYADVANSTVACFQSLNTELELTCSNLPTDCQTLQTKIKGTGCCAPYIANALGGPFRRIFSCSNEATTSCAAPKSVATVTFNITIPNLNFDKIKNKINNITASILKDLSKQYRVPYVSVKIVSVKKSASGNGTTVTVSIGFPSVTGKNEAITISTGTQVPLPETASAMQSNSEALNDPQSGVVASLDSATETSTSTNNTDSNNGGKKGDAGSIGVPHVLISTLAVFVVALLF